MELATCWYIDIPGVGVIDLEVSQLPEKVIEVAMDWMFTELSIMETIATVGHVSDNFHKVCRCKAKPMMGMAIDARRRTFLCRASPARGMATDVSTDRLQISRAAAHLRHQRAHRSPTTISAPTQVRTPTPMLTHRHSSSGHPRTLLLRPCCCSATRSLQPLRRDECASS
jgi:hypothetical protein